MTIEIIVWFIVLILGLGIMVFSSQIATFIHNVNLELRRELTGSTKEKNPKKKWWLLSPYSIGLRYGPRLDILILRIMGIFTVVVAAFLIVELLVTN